MRNKKQLSEPRQSTTHAYRHGRCVGDNVVGPHSVDFEGSTFRSASCGRIIAGRQPYWDTPASLSFRFLDLRANVCRDRRWVAEPSSTLVALDFPFLQCDVITTQISSQFIGSRSGTGLTDQSKSHENMSDGRCTNDILALVLSWTSRDLISPTVDLTRGRAQCDPNRNSALKLALHEPETAPSEEHPQRANEIPFAGAILPV